MNQTIPKNWTSARIDQLCELSKEKGAAGVTPYLEIGNVDIARKSYVLTKKPAVKGCKIAKQGDVLVSRVRPTRGAIVEVKESAIPVSSAFSILRNRGALTEKYLLYSLAWNRDYLRYLGENCTGTMYPTTSDEVVGEYEVAVAPLGEQLRIVKKVEELLPELDEATKELEAAQAELKRYRASVLAAACSGKLVPTEAELARSEGRSYENAADLLERILKERREKWNGRGKYKEPVTPDTTALPALPEGWVWSSLGEVFEVFVGATPSRARRDFWDGDIAWVSSGEVAFCSITKTKEKITALGLENSSTNVHPAGTVMLGMIGEGKTRGQAAILKIPAAHNQNTAAIRVSSTEIPPSYVYRFLEGRYEVTRSIGSGNNQPALNKALVERMPIPIPPLEEINRITADVERRLSVADEIEQVLAANLQRSERLRQSILQQAFTGKLVQQNAGDESAAALLERISAERVDTAPRKKVTSKTHGRPKTAIK